MKAKKNIIRYVMLIAGIIMLLSVIIPHHHHSNGLPCFKPLTEHSHKSASSHDCGCNGHNVALSPLCCHMRRMWMLVICFSLCKFYLIILTLPNRLFADNLLIAVEPFILSLCTIAG